MEAQTRKFEGTKAYEEEKARLTKVVAGKPRIKFETYSAAELEKQEFPEPKFAVPGIIPEGLSILAGAPKLGKSWFALNICLAVACGGKALGSIDVEQGEALYIALEDTKRRMKKRIADLIGDDPFPPGLSITHVSPKLTDGLEAEIEAWLIEHPGARLIVIDTLQRARRHIENRQQTYAGDYAEVAKLQELASKHGIAILVVHHIRKMVSDDPLEMVSGTFGISGGADSVLILRRSRGATDATLSVLGRDIEEQELALNFTHGAWDVIGAAQEYAMSNERRDIITILRKAGRMYPRELAEALDKKPGAVRVMLLRMTEEGQVSVDDKGRYFISLDMSNSSNACNSSNSSNACNGGSVTALHPYASHPEREKLKQNQLPLSSVTGVTLPKVTPLVRNSPVSSAPSATNATGVTGVTANYQNSRELSALGARTVGKTNGDVTRS